MPFVTQMPTQEQLEALYKTIPASQDQLEAVQKQMMAFLEQQQKAATALGLATSSAGGGAASTVAPPTTENQVFPFPLVFALGVPATAAPSPLTVSEKLINFFLNCFNNNLSLWRNFLVMQYIVYAYMCMYCLFYTCTCVRTCTT